MATQHGGVPAHYLNQIIVGDALALLRTLPDESVPMFLFSPPYNMGRQVKGEVTDKKANRRKWRNPSLVNGYSDHEDAMEWSEYTEWQKSILAECWRCLTPNGAIYYQHKPRHHAEGVILPLAYAAPEMTLRQIITWARDGGINFNPAFYMPTTEWVVVWAKTKWRLKSNAASGVGDVWRFSQAPSWHPAPFPIALATRALETVMPSLVVDPFMGSGTTAKAAVKLGIDYIGFELSETYAKRARKEIADIAAQPRLIPIEGKQEVMAI